MANREFVMLSHTLKLSEAKTWSLSNWFVSEKLDGMRAIWLPDTLGIQVSRLPFANLDKDRTGSGNRISTGLWSRYAKPIWAPPWFTEHFPRDRSLDGELWTGRNEFQRLTSIVKQGHPGPEWSAVQYRVFDSPSFDAVYRDGKIHNGQLKKNLLGVWPWCKRELAYDYQTHQNTFDRTWHQVLKPLNPWLTDLRAAVDIARNGGDIAKGYLIAHPQEQLPWRHPDAVERLNKLLTETLEQGGEGLIVRAPHSTWEPVRSKLCLKIKPENEADATVVGYTPGQGRLEGMIGSLTVRGELAGRPVLFGLSGMTDEQRKLNADGTSPLFPDGTIVSYLYRETTDDGQPREARFLRIRSDL